MKDSCKPGPAYLKTAVRAGKKISLDSQERKILLLQESYLLIQIL
jgi:hypothetical protein